MTLWQRVVQANKPGPPEHSVPFRVASAATVVGGRGRLLEPGRAEPGRGRVRHRGHRGRQRPLLLATRSGRGRRSSPSWPSAPWAASSGSSPRSPARPRPATSPRSRARWPCCSPGSCAPTPSTCPARRDLAFSLAGSATLMAVAAAQAVDLAFGVYVVAWVGVRPVGPRGHVAVDGGRPAGSRGSPWARPGWPCWWWRRCWWPCCPPPRCPRRSIFPSSVGRVPAGRHPQRPHRRPASLPAHAASSVRPHPGGRATSDSPSRSTPAVRGSLGNQVVMRVRASRPELLGRRDLRHLERPELAGVGAGQGPGRGQTGHRVALRDPAEPGPAGGRVRRRHRHPDLLHGPVGTQPGLPRRQRRAGLVPVAHPLS